MPGRPKLAWWQRKVKLWFVLAVGHGYDRYVQSEIIKEAKKAGVKKLIGRILIAKHIAADGRRVMSFPGYLMIRCRFTEEVFHVINSVPGVDGFLMDPHKPTPLQSEEAARVLIQTHQKKPKPQETPCQPAPEVISCPYGVGQRVRITEGAWAGHESEIDIVAMPNLFLTVKVIDRPVKIQVLHTQVEKI